MRRTQVGPLVIAIIAGVAVLSVTGFVVGLSLGPSKADYDDRPAAVQAWCDDVRHAFGPPSELRSFRAVAAAALDGRLRRPSDDPPLADPKATERWQADHASYLTSSYLQLLEGYPNEVALQAAVFKFSLDEAHAGERLRYRADLPGVAAHLDRFERDRC